MRRPRALLRLTELLAGAALAATAYVWLIGPIRTEARVRPINWEDPMRPLLLALGLAALRLAIPWAARGWGRVGPPAARLARRPTVWLVVLAAVAGGWYVAGLREYGRLSEEAERSRDSGHAAIGLATRPTLTALEMIDGVALSGASEGAIVEIACGLEAEAAPWADPRPRGQLLVGAAGGSPGDRVHVITCDASPGAWRAARFAVPAGVGPEPLLFVRPEGGDTKGHRLAYWSRPRVLPEPDPSRTNLVIISLDTLRADHLGAYGYPRPVSPRIDRLARRGALFENAIAQAPWTTPSHMSLFTSLYPGSHGVDAPTSNRQRRLPEDKRTLAEVIGDAGYATAAFTGSGSISALYGFWRGFDIYDETDKDDPARRGEDVSGVFEKASRWIVDNGQRPFFLFFHTYEPHAPYVHETFLGEVEPGDEAAATVARYDGDILYADGFVGQLLDLLAGIGVLDRTIVVLLSDHGEELQPRYPGRRFKHGHTLYDDLLRVPLIVAAPGVVPEGLRVPDVVQLVDVMPTVLEMMGIPAPQGLQGPSLAAVFRGEPRPEREAFAEATNFGPERKAVRSGRHKYIETFARGDAAAGEIPVPVPAVEFFDLREDPQERHPLRADGSAERERLRRLLHDIVALNARLRGETPDQELDPETLKRLKALGYIN